MRGNKKSIHWLIFIGPNMKKIKYFRDPKMYLNKNFKKMHLKIIRKIKINTVWCSENILYC
jgi:hypothetical protein